MMMVGTMMKTVPVMPVMMMMIMTAHWMMMIRKIIMQTSAQIQMLIPVMTVHLELMI